MTTTKEQIGKWFDYGLKNGYEYMVVMCDTFDWEDYPSYNRTRASALLDWNSPDKMQKPMEAYWLKGDREAQLSQLRCNALDAHNARPSETSREQS